MTRQFKVSLLYPNGAPILLGTVLAEEMDAPALPPTAGSPQASGPRPDNGERMTEPQKRYLFRLLAAQNVTGKQAEEHLKHQFQVGKLSDASKAAASEYINQLVADRKEAAS